MVIGGTASPASALSLEGWTTGEAQTAGMWYQIELPKTVRLAGIDYQGLVGRLRNPPPAAAPAAAAPPPAAAPAAAGAAGAAAPPRFTPPRQMSFYPRGYKLEVSTDGKTWKTVKQAKGESMYNSLAFEPVQAKFVRFTTTEAATDGAYWGMRYLKLFEKPTA